MTDYTRFLDLQTAIAGVEYCVDGVHFKREHFASAPDQLLIIRITADKPGMIDFSAEFETVSVAAALSTVTKPIKLIWTATARFGIATVL